tara:strand:+ start:1949 stop:2587 length:639 start_codon:yes stop_codon:yes gene_type:complete
MARKQKKYHYIYKTTNLLSGKYYIGMHSTDNLDDGYIGSGTRLRYSINKHGKNNHKLKILEFCNSREELIAREKEIVNLNEIAKVECMNLMVGGQGGFISVEQQRYRSECGGKGFSKRLKEDDKFKKTHSKIVGLNFKNAHKDGKIKYDTMKGKRHSDETKKKMSESSKGKGKGRDNSQFGSCWITNEIINKKVSKNDLIPDGWRLGRVIKK